jgi:hypothetical protein
MPHQNGMDNHLEALCAKHAAIGEKIKRESQHSSLPDQELRTLKAERLHLKDEIEHLRHQADHHDDYAEF